MARTTASSGFEGRCTSGPRPGGKPHRPSVEPFSSGIDRKISHRVNLPAPIYPCIFAGRSDKEVKNENCRNRDSDGFRLEPAPVGRRRDEIHRRRFGASPDTSAGNVRPAGIAVCKCGDGRRLHDRQRSPQHVETGRRPETGLCLEQAQGGGPRFPPFQVVERGDLHVAQRR